jgi:hypothetical protein
MAEVFLIEKKSEESHARIKMEMGWLRICSGLRDEDYSGGKIGEW